MQVIHSHTKNTLQLTHQTALQRLHTAHRCTGGAARPNAAANVRQSVVLPQIETIPRQAHVAILHRTADRRVQCCVAAAKAAGLLMQTAAQSMRQRVLMVLLMRLRLDAVVVGRCRRAAENVAVIVGAFVVEFAELRRSGGGGLLLLQDGRRSRRYGIAVVTGETVFAV